MARNASQIIKTEFLKDVIHKCKNVMYVIPRQKYTFDDNVESYVVALRSESSYSDNKYPDGVAKSSHKFCPYCGQPLYVIEKGE